MTIYLASDHAGFELKNSVKAFFQTETDYQVQDLGAHTFSPDDDYPDFISLAAEKVTAMPHHRRAIIFGGSGQGEAMLANRYPNVRATVYYSHNLDIITLSRQHNDANVLSIGARFVTAEQAIEAITHWLKTEPLGDEKYMRRVKKVERMSTRG